MAKSPASIAGVLLIRAWYADGMKTYLYASIFLFAGLCGQWVFGFGAPGAASWVGWSAFSILIAGALALQKSWVEPALFGVALFVCVQWIATIVVIAIQGWPEHGFVASLLSLVPGAFFCGFWILMWFLIKRQSKPSN